METKTQLVNFCACPHCGGTGRTQLPDSMQRVLDDVKAHGRVSSTDVMQRLNAREEYSVSLARFCKILRDLNACGLLARQGARYNYTYSPTHLAMTDTASVNVPAEGTR